jgi:hypothetical protein
LSQGFKHRKAVATVFLNSASRFRVSGFAVLTAGILFVVAGGCGYASINVNDVLDAQIRDVTGTVPTNTSTILLVNQTQTTIELDILVDGTLNTVTVTPDEGEKSFTPTVCPLTVEVVLERRLNSLGAVVGGRNFDHNAAFVFTEDEFTCVSTIVFTFTEDQTTPAVL